MDAIATGDRGQEISWKLVSLRIANSEGRNWQLRLCELRIFTSRVSYRVLEYSTESGDSH